MLLSLVIAAVLLVVLAACGWTAIVRPALHTAVDSRLRAAMSAEVDKVPVVPEVPFGRPSITLTFPESVFNQQTNSSGNSGDIQDVHIYLHPGVVEMTYRLWGRPGTITTHPVARNGRLFVQGTRVTGLIAQVENGDELQDSINESLARLPAQDYVENVSIGEGTLTLTIRHA